MRLPKIHSVFLLAALTVAFLLPAVSLSGCGAVRERTFGGDYLGRINQGAYKFAPGTLTVYYDASLTDEQRRACIEAQDKWNATLDSRWQFEEVADRNIASLWWSAGSVDALGGDDGNDAGTRRHSIDTPGGRRFIAEIVFTSSLSGRPLRAAALHEGGHGLCALAGHSNDPTDIMYRFNISALRASEISERDARTVRRLYDLEVSQ